MQKTLILGCALFFGAFANSEASPLDSPDIVYIDGQPCNTACQSYMAWSRQAMPVPDQYPRVQAKAAVRRQARHAQARRATEIREAGSKHAANDGRAKSAAPTPAEKPQAATADLQAAGKTAATSDSAAAAASVTTVGTAAHSATRTSFEQVQAAVTVAERLTATTTVAIVIARPEIKSVSDLAGKEIAVDDKLSAVTNHLRTAIATAGAADVQLAESETNALDRLMVGVASAAVLVLASPEASEGFPDIAGFRIFRIPLSSH